MILQRGLLLIGCVAMACRAAVGVESGRVSPPPFQRDSGSKVKATTPDIRIPMRDGKWLGADIWLPDTEGRFATVLIMTPYSRKNIGSPLPDKNLELDLPDLNRFAMVVVDWRGYFGSKAASRRPAGLPQQAKDGYDVVEWIAKQSWSNGRVGMWGASGPGRVQFAVASEQPPHLAAIAPLVASDGFHHSLFYYGGVLKKAYVDMLGTAGFGAQRRVRKTPPVENAFWRRIEDTTTHTRKIDVPTMMLTGWYDLSVETVLTTFTALREHGGATTRKTLRLWVGPWHHVSLGKREQGELSFPDAEGLPADVSNAFFDHYLLREDNGWEDGPLATYIRMGHNEWFTSDSFPPQRGDVTSFYLAKEGALQSEPLKHRDEVDTFEHDPTNPSPTIGGMNAFIGIDPKYKTVGAGPRDQRPVEARPDALVFTSEVLGSDIVLEGHAVVTLFVSSDRADTDFAIRLTDVYEDGRSMLITDGIQRMRYRGDREKQPLLTRGKIYEVDVTLAITAHTFVKGHRIRIVVSSANAPRFDVNPNVDRPRLLGAKYLVATNGVHFGKEYRSKVTLPRWKGVKPAKRVGKRD